MKNKFLIIIMLVLLKQSQVGYCQQNDIPIPEAQLEDIKKTTIGEIVKNKAKYCPLTREKAEKGEWHENYDPWKLVHPNISNVDYVLNVKRWPDYSKNKTICMFLVEKKLNTFSRYVGYDSCGMATHRVDTFKNVETPCQQYFPYDEKFLLYYDRTEKMYYNVSGNLYLCPMFWICTPREFSDMDYMSEETARCRMAQYTNSKTRITDKVETEKYYELKFNNTVFPAICVKVRIPKTKEKRDFGQEWEIIYYSNKKTIPIYDENTWYEVKYRRFAEPKSYEDFFPKYRKMSKEELSEGWRYKNGSLLDAEFPFPED